MRSVFLTLALIANAFLALAQNLVDNYDGPKITYGLAGGSNYASLSVKAPTSYQAYTSLTSPLSVGFNLDFQYNDYFSIRPALIYQGMGGKVSGTNNFAVASIYNLHYLEIPVDFIGHLPVGNAGANIFLGAGPFIAKGISANSKTETATALSDVQATYQYKFGNGGDFKSLDYGATTVLGFQLNRGFAVSMNVDIGMTNILQKHDLYIQATTAKTTTIYFSIGQSF
ncbi:outer membrane beta-barrel protein [Mucilaginibacter sp. dw_454]|uniref:outer membrane beta-barrel protein n=1 Tax=Mucilaginibacter sp. dw_454 TaxID=2720079 RepID=UPI001BD6C374|nr:outer membrane beta-barrel protein [Mucilaginibacter sp. dw_454]